jgi:hypothetical protein
VKVEYSETSVLATANQASKEAPAGRLPISPDKAAVQGRLLSKGSRRPLTKSGMFCMATKG